MDRFLIRYHCFRLAVMVATVSAYLGLALLFAWLCDLYIAKWGCESALKLALTVWFCSGCWRFLWKHATNFWRETREE